jgi:DNA polymerase I-like protein with 3'-5' exonuclease and polymerase domains
MALVVDDDHDAASDQFFAAVETAVSNTQQVQVAFDCEGVNLSRIGTVELVAVCFGGGGDTEANGQVFLVDLNRNSKISKLQARFKALKKLLECGTVQKVIHDAKMDCDALFHLHGIRVEGIHDTSCYHHVETGREDAPLNIVLGHNGIEVNENRDKSVYQRNPRFWETRPLTKAMIAWSSSDVDKLLTVAKRQSDTLKASGSYDAALRKSAENATSVSDGELQHGIVCRVPVGRLIGPGGSNIRSLQRRTNTTIYQDREAQTWMVYHNTQTSLNAVKRAMGY